LPQKSAAAENVGSEEDLPPGELARRIAAYFGTEVAMARQAVQGS
jgi:hypothetical protein